ncbi:hypothetical protein GIB67_030740 [Kingdonia uniflora]|uniref:OCRE domain-containing protein n=1 Tax=Kingdonia uniflora TaxID=39325 RepID=A0A7J7L2V7_9MAGN|nr:hypothetical protein GIB67_030740 [Kingdonia uniflora]
MAGKEETEEMMKENECAFEWDEDSKLYFHASSGFYHDPNAGWYYSSKDGLYYKFENGSYVRLEPDKDEELEALVVQREIISNEHIPDELCPVESIDGDKHENLPPPSEWLEETLIDLYLSGYSESAINDVNGPVMPSETDADYDPNLLLHANDDTYEREEGEWIPEEFQEATGLSGRLSDEGLSCYYFFTT